MGCHGRDRHSIYSSGSDASPYINTRTLSSIFRFGEKNAPCCCQRYHFGDMDNKFILSLMTSYGPDSNRVEAIPEEPET